MLSRRKLYDYRDVDRRELKLIRAGQAIWTLYRRERRFSGGTGAESDALLAACEIVWALKRELRQELKAKRAAAFSKWRGSGGKVQR